MRRFACYLSPKQWEEIDTSEAKIDLITMCERQIVIGCENSLVIATSWGSSLPDKMLLLTGNRARIAKCILAIKSPKHFSIRASIYSESRGRYIQDREGQEVVVSKRWGEPESALNQYRVWGHLEWPRATISELAIASDRLLKICFNGSDLQVIK